MQRALAVTLLALAAVMVLTSLGCTTEDRYRAVVLRNQEQEKMLQDKDMQLAQMNERVKALQVQKTDTEQMLADKDRLITSVESERDAYKKAYEESSTVVKRIAGRPAPLPGSGEGLPEALSLGIEQVLRSHPGLFEFDRAAGRLRFASDIAFASGSNAVQPDTQTALRQLATVLAGNAGMGLSTTVVGHTDSDPVKKPATIALLKGLGKAPTNAGLSEARAEAVAAILVSGGVDAGHVRTEGKGATEPLGQDKAQNRRVEIFLK